MLLKALQLALLHCCDLILTFAYPLKNVTDLMESLDHSVITPKGLNHIDLFDLNSKMIMSTPTNAMHDGTIG